MSMSPIHAAVTLGETDGLVGSVARNPWVHGLDHLERRAPISRTIRRVTASIASCSQTRITAQPSASSAALVSASRAWLVAILRCHQSGFDLGFTPWSGHPCQKHPSTNTAILCRGNEISTVRRGRLGILACTRYRRPRACKARRRCISGAVAPLRARADMTRDHAGEDAPGCRPPTLNVLGSLSFMRRTRLGHSLAQPW